MQTESWCGGSRKCESEIYSNIIRSLTVRGNALSRVRMNAIGASRYSSSESSFQRHFLEPATLRCWAVFVCAVGEKMCTRAHNPNLIKQTRAKKPEGCGFFECLSVYSVTEPMLAVSATIPWLITQSRSSRSSLGAGRESLTRKHLGEHWQPYQPFLRLLFHAHLHHDEPGDQDLSQWHKPAHKLLPG